MPAITAQRQIWPLAFLDVIYYILNKEIQEFVVKIKMLFLRSLEIFIFSKEINLCRLDTFPTMVANRPVMYNRVRVLDFFEFYSVCSCSYTHVSNRHGLPLSIANKQTDAVRHCIFLNKACGVFFFGSVELIFFVYSFISSGMALPYIFDASDFAIRNVSFNPNKGDYPL